jgi:ABC-type multidrug transport system fused ATPase/permease subunit
LLERGEVKGRGTYDELIAKSHRFATMAEAV